MTATLTLLGALLVSLGAMLVLLANLRGREAVTAAHPLGLGRRRGRQRVRHPRPLRLRPGDQVADRDRGHQVLRLQGLLDDPRLHRVEAELAPQDNVGTWRQWSYEWDEATSGILTVDIRATNRNGETQTSDRAPVRPNEATGWQSVQFRVE